MASERPSVSISSLATIRTVYSQTLDGSEIFYRVIRNLDSTCLDTFVWVAILESSHPYIKSAKQL